MIPVILFLAFGSVTAAALPIGMAVLGLAVGTSAMALLANLMVVPSYAPVLGAMVGLGVGIDYALFIVTRHKLQLGEGMEVRESIARATATAGGAVVFAGFTMYDFQRLRRTQDIRAAPLLAASIFLDVLNVFLLLLSLFNRD